MTDNAWNEPPQGSSDQKPPKDATGREWKLIEQLLMSQTREAKRGRRWGIFFKLMTFAYLFFVLMLFVPRFDLGSTKNLGGDHTALVEIQGAIAEGEAANADAVVAGVRAAFKNKNTKGVILRINSPGGTPVQAGYIYDEIVRLRKLHPEIKLYAVISDLGASGGYYVAAAADEIYADKASLVGSIGVISSSFGFVNAMEKLGVERRLYTAGKNKAFLDPFSPQKEVETQFWQGVLAVTHQQFIDRVRAGRGERLADDPALFSGLIWTGEQALELGLIDGLGSAGYVAREIIGEKHIVDFTLHKTPLEELAEKLGVSISRSLVNQLGFQQPRFQ